MQHNVASLNMKSPVWLAFCSPTLRRGEFNWAIRNVLSFYPSSSNAEQKRRKKETTKERRGKDDKKSSSHRHHRHHRSSRYVLLLLLVCWSVPEKRFLNTLQYFVVERFSFSQVKQLTNAFKYPFIKYMCFIDSFLNILLFMFSLHAHCKR